MAEQSDGPQPIEFQMQLPPEQEVGVFADFTNIWHTPNTFVLDFLAVKAPPHLAVNEDGSVRTGLAVLEARVASRVRIPSEQIFPLIHALQTQGEQWLKETGRAEPPENWVK